MPYRCRLFNSIADVDLEAWKRVCSESGASIFMDPRFIAGVEASMIECRFWYVIVHDDDDHPVACAGLAAMPIDLAELADPRLGWMLRHVPVVSKFRKLKVLFCSLPGSPGERSLALATTNATAQIISMLDETISQLATDTGMDVIVYKEFAEHQLIWINPLLDLGYQRIEVPAMHLFDHSFADFTQYCAALKKHYRWEINHSLRKMKNGGITSSVLSDSDDILKAYTPDVHAMYRQMVAKSDVKVEFLPIEYFRQLTLRLSGEVDLITLSKGSEIVAFAWCLYDGQIYHMLYGGLDHQRNREFDLYFNLTYAGFDRAFRRGATRINVGQTATGFKSRLGCDSEPLYAFAKGLGPLMSRFFYYGASLMVIDKPSKPPSNIFKNGFVHEPTQRH